MIAFVVCECTLIISVIFIKNMIKDKTQLLDIRNENDIAWYIGNVELETKRKNLNNKQSRF